MVVVEVVGRCVCYQVVGPDSVFPNRLEIDVATALSTADTPPLALVPRSEAKRSSAGREVDAAP